MNNFITYVLILFYVLIQPSAYAETIYLKDGSTVNGTIKNITTNAVIIDSALGEKTIDGEKILRIGDDIPKQGDLQIKEQQYDQLGLGQDVEEFFGFKQHANLTKKTYAESRIWQKNGLGIGFAGGSMQGQYLFYDHNFTSESQFHIQLNSQGVSRKTILGSPVMTTTRNMIVTTYRNFFSENKGYYWGVGGGYATSKLIYRYSSTPGTTPTEYDSRLDGVFVLGELGWQGVDGFYFNAGLQPAAYVSSNDNFDVSKIPNISNHQSTAIIEHNKLMDLSQIFVGFGWFF